MRACKEKQDYHFIYAPAAGERRIICFECAPDCQTTRVLKNLDEWSRTLTWFSQRTQGKPAPIIAAKSFAESLPSSSYLMKPSVLVAKRLEPSKVKWDVAVFAGQRRPRCSRHTFRRLVAPTATYGPSTQQRFKR